MKKVVYVLIAHSCGEVKNSLDDVKVFDTEEKATAALKECYESLLKDVDGYDFEQNEFYGDSYSVILEDDDWSIYEGCIIVTEVE